jgi:hypothetical protein
MYCFKKSFYIVVKNRMTPQLRACVTSQKMIKPHTLFVLQPQPPLHPLRTNTPSLVVTILCTYLIKNEPSYSPIEKDIGLHTKKLKIYIVLLSLLSKLYYYLPGNVKVCYALPVAC